MHTATLQQHSRVMHRGLSQTAAAGPLALTLLSTSRLLLQSPRNAHWFYGVWRDLSVEVGERAVAPLRTVLFRRMCANFAGAGHRSRIATGLSMPPQWQLLAQHRNSMMGAGVK